MGLKQPLGMGSVIENICSRCTVHEMQRWTGKKKRMRKSRATKLVRTRAEDSGKCHERHLRESPRHLFRMERGEAPESDLRGEHHGARQRSPG
eukprot:6192451-Pleurochrysis_carterae.AAC.4